jgi:2'-5' RNA ligase
LKTVGARVGWVAPENIHLTLVFLGNIFGAQVAPLSEALDEIAAAVPPFRFAVEGAGSFGSARSPRVVWAGVADPEGRLASLQSRIVGVVKELGIRIEEREFKPHLTLGRVRSSYRAGELTSPLASATNASYGSVDVHRLLLMQSHLEHQGVRYSVLHESALKGAT